ncbi:MAG: SMC-Scp complex subunit ScpB [Nitrososphaerota archaeon]|nr:SMC-Scp complex subunit ScpB [Nitrososphaerota archaeon]
MTTEDNDKEIQARIEAALYASGRPLSPDELAKAGGIRSKRKAVNIARSLAKLINSTLSSIEIIELQDHKFVMQLKPEYNKIAKRFSTKPLLPYSVLKTLSYIAYFQPISSQELVSQRGSQVYHHLKLLEDLGFIVGERSGRTYIYKTTAAFSDYFGLSRDLNTLKQQLAKAKLGRMVKIK